MLRVTAALCLAAVSASAEPASVPPWRAPAVGVTEADLNYFFEKSVSGSQDAPPPVQGKPAFILRVESPTPPDAPRYALNLDAVPPELRHTVPGFSELFHKNQEETREWVDKVNAHIRAKNAARKKGKIPEWTYDGRVNEPPFTCLSNAAGTVNDWWSLQLGKPLPEYDSANNGAREVGIDQRMLELKYYERVGGDPRYYFLVPKQIEHDPVRNNASPYEPRGYAEILLEDKPYSVTDPFTDKTYRYDPSQGSMEGQFLNLFGNDYLRAKTRDKYARVLAEAIDKWGIAYVQLEHTDHPRLKGAHSLAGVGYFCLEDQTRLIPCSQNKSDKDWGRTTYFILHDSFGNFPADKDRAPDGGPAYRAVRIESVDQALVFPHGLAVAAKPEPGRPGFWRLSVTNKGGKPVEVLKIWGFDAARPVGVERAEGGGFLVAPGVERLTLHVEAKHYFEADGKARRFALALDPAAETAAVEIPRSKPTPTWSQRLGR